MTPSQGSSSQHIQGTRHYHARLGHLLIYDTPQFQQVGATTSIPYSSYVNYAFSADYENDKATLQWTLVTLEDGTLKAWAMKINSDAFLDTLESSEETSTN